MGGGRRCDPVILGNAAAAGSTLAWVLAFPVTELLLAGWDPLALAAVRLLGAGLLLSGLLALSWRRRELRWAPWGRVLQVGGIGIGLSAFSLVLGQHWSGPVTAAIIATTSPALSVLYQWWTDGERPRPHVLAGVVLSVAGAILASVRPFGDDPGLRGGEPLLLLTAFLWVWYSRASMVHMQGLSDLSRAALATLAGGLVLVLVVGLATLAGIGPLRVEWSVERLGQLALLVVAVAASGGLWMPAVRLLGVTIASLHLNLAPLYVILLSLPAGVHPTPGQIAGAVLVVAGTTLAQWPRRREEPVAAEPAAVERRAA